MKKSVCVFCGSSLGRNPIYEKRAKELGESLHAGGHTLVYGAASVGVMGAIANSVLDKGGCVKGVIPQSIVDMEVAHDGLSELKIVDTMHDRKKIMYDWSDAFVALPGGMGTLDELCEIVTWAQLKYHHKPCYILNTDGFFDNLIEHFRFINQEGFLSDEHLGLIRVVDTVGQLMRELAN